MLNPPENISDDHKRNKHQAERRQYQRIAQSFILSYFDLKSPKDKQEITQLKNISLGGMCFISSVSLPEGAKLGIDLKTPYIGSTTYFEGLVEGSHEKVKDLIYETRLKFINLHPDAEFLLNKLIEYFVRGEGKTYE